MRTTDDEFIAIWNKYHSAARVAEVLDIQVRNVHARRKVIEEKLNNFVQFSLALMQLSGPTKWAQAKMNAEMMNYIKSIDS